MSENAYQKMISSRLLSTNKEMIGNLAQPTMFGGKIAREYILPGEVSYSYPDTLSVGAPVKRPRTISKGFWVDSPEAVLSEAPPHGGKRYKVKSFINDVNALGKLIPKSTREAITAKANQEISGSGMSGGKKYKVKSFINDVNALGKLIPKSTREAITAKANQEITGAGVKKRRSKKMDVEDWLDGGALTSRGFTGQDDTAYPKALLSLQGGKKYKVKSFINDVNALGKLIPKSTREAATARANQEIMGAGVGKKKGRPITARGELIRKIMNEMGLSLCAASSYIKDNGLW
jgi:hypothetical protein